MQLQGPRHPNLGSSSAALALFIILAWLTFGARCFSEAAGELSCAILILLLSLCPGTTAAAISARDNARISCEMKLFFPSVGVIRAINCSAFPWKRILGVRVSFGRVLQRQETPALCGDKSCGIINALTLVRCIFEFSETPEFYSQCSLFLSS